MIKFTPVQSSNIKEVAHEGTSLHVRFKGGAEGHYEGVSPQTYQQLISAPSKGKFLRAQVMPGAKWFPKGK